MPLYFGPKPLISEDLREADQSTSEHVQGDPVGWCGEKNFSKFLSSHERYRA